MIVGHAGPEARSLLSHILDDAVDVLAPFTEADGVLRARFSADVVVARRP
jgi:hypothetical protein